MKEELFCFFLLFFSPWCQIRKHACTHQPHYMLFGCLMRAGWKMENVPSVVCLMAGFLSAHHTAGVPGWSRQHPSAGHCREKTHCFSTHIIIIISLNSHCSATSKHPAMGRRCSSPTSKHLPEDLNAVICDYFQCQLICWCFFSNESINCFVYKKGNSKKHLQMPTEPKVTTTNGLFCSTNGPKPKDIKSTTI